MQIVKNAKTRIFPGGQKFKAEKNLTFSNDTGTLTLFNVTGDVIVEIIPIVITAVASVAAANIRLGIVGSTNAMIADTLATDLGLGLLWLSPGVDSKIEPYDAARRFIITEGTNIVLTLSAQVDSGAITFYCFWTPLSVDGNVVAA
jgi:hypothetical protein